MKTLTATADANGNLAGLTPGAQYVIIEAPGKPVIDVHPAAAMAPGVTRQTVGVTITTGEPTQAASAAPAAATETPAGVRIINAPVEQFASPAAVEAAEVKQGTPEPAPAQISAPEPVAPAAAK